jgi:hypothetical protein
MSKKKNIDWVTTWFNDNLTALEGFQGAGWQFIVHPKHGTIAACQNEAFLVATIRFLKKRIFKKSVVLNLDLAFEQMMDDGEQAQAWQDSERDEDVRLEEGPDTVSTYSRAHGLKPVNSLLQLLDAGFTDVHVNSELTSDMLDVLEAARTRVDKSNEPQSEQAARSWVQSPHQQPPFDPVPHDHVTAVVGMSRRDLRLD